MSHWVDNPTGIGIGSGPDESHPSIQRKADHHDPQNPLALDEGVTAALLIVLGLVFGFNSDSYFDLG